MGIFNFHGNTTHVGFADEAYWNRGEFRAVACVSTRLDNRDYHEVERRLCASRCDAGAIVSEIKWAETRTRDRQRDAAAALETTVALASERKLRLDVLIWDERIRHSLERMFGNRGNREVAHLQFMYRSLFSQVLARWRSIEGSAAPFWTIAPDRHTGLNFRTLQREINQDAESAVDTVIEVKDVKDTLNYSIQLADLVAGLVAYSHSNSEDYEIWLRRGKQRHLVLLAPQWQHRFPLIDAFSSRTRFSHSGVSMLEPAHGFFGKGLLTRDSDPAQTTVTIWPYTPDFF
ncbi:MAG: hypothetical protein OXF44_01450 [Anaerolineaceae bacterium]|nr:hypothetical protein [Anaerolineaceae bacterium]